MDGNILITYASKYGATKEIAEKIGEVLRQAGLQVDVLPAKSIRELSPYTAVILGSAVYVGKWHQDGADFLRKFQKSLMDRPLWLFSSGPTGEGEALELVDGLRLPANLQPIADSIQPRDIVVFHGFIDAQKVNRIEKWAVKSLVKKPFGDFRDWGAITAWGASVAEALKKAENVPWKILATGD